MDFRFVQEVGEETWEAEKDVFYSNKIYYKVCWKDGAHLNDKTLSAPL